MPKRQESIVLKGRRLLMCNGRVRVLRAKETGILAGVVGDHGKYYVRGLLAEDGKTVWTCTCPSQTGCSHVEAIKLIWQPIRGTEGGSVG